MIEVSLSIAAAWVISGCRESQSSIYLGSARAGWQFTGSPVLMKALHEISATIEAKNGSQLHRALKPPSRRDHQRSVGARI